LIIFALLRLLLCEDEDISQFSLMVLILCVAFVAYLPEMIERLL
jgi:hypothetical protein